MIENITPNIIVGTVIIVINMIPLIMKKYKLLLMTTIVSLLLAFLLSIGVF